MPYSATFDSLWYMLINALQLQHIVNFKQIVIWKLLGNLARTPVKQLIFSCEEIIADSLCNTWVIKFNTPPTPAFNFPTPTYLKFYKDKIMQGYYNKLTNLTCILSLYITTQRLWIIIIIITVLTILINILLCSSLFKSRLSTYMYHSDFISPYFHS